jgi:sarcosine oxidase
MARLNHLTFDAAVVGAGVFGAWTALKLQRAGMRVALLDAHGAGNSRASSGGESRVIRMGYGADEIYTRSAVRSFAEWREFVAQKELPLFYHTGVLWLAHEDDPYVRNTKDALIKNGVACEELSRTQLERRYPQIHFGEVSWGLLEVESGVLMARQLVQAVVKEAIQHGVTYLDAAAVASVENQNSSLNDIHIQGGRRISADRFVFACGPWLPKLFPRLLGELIRSTRQEVFFFGVPASDARYSSKAMPAWIDFHDLVYAIPDLERRGLKIAIDQHGPAFDPETGDRTVSHDGVAAIRTQLARCLPSLANAPIVETRVCQYENTSNGDFLIDRHPDFENLWLVGGGSGHGFKHGPAVGEYVTALVTGESVRIEPRFTLATKSNIRDRVVY